ncbi:MAG: TetR/AcrR family transcriptional regulator [Frankia sp.]
MTGSERTDAARNRAAILAAADALFDRGTETVSMNDIAEAAGVGKGTVFRRFGDRTALIHALLQPRSAALRERIEHGPPPLGPGGPPAEALRAYLNALLEFVWANRALIRAFEQCGLDTYYTSPYSQYWIDELRRRLTATAPGTSLDYLAHILFTALRADFVNYLSSARAMPLDDIREGLYRLADV